MRLLTRVLALSATIALAVPLTLTATATANSTTKPSASTAYRGPLCHGKRPTIVKGARRNVIIGTSHRDVIVAGGGRDVIWARGGRDLICGGPGADIIDGAHGLDVIFGGTGFDRCFAPMGEHRYHSGCESHVVGTIKPPGPRKPPPPTKARALSPIQAPSSALAERGGGFVADADFPTCGRATITYGNFYFTAEYTDPGYVAYRTIYVAQLGTGGFSNNIYNPWYYVNAPNDGQVYQWDVGTFNVPSNTYLLGYEVYWWNGSQWANDTIITFDHYGMVAPPFGVVDFSTCVT
jgi:hemolysin type calcium-binding protein